MRPAQLRRTHNPNKRTRSSSARHRPQPHSPSHRCLPHSSFISPAHTGETAPPPTPISSYLTSSPFFPSYLLSLVISFVCLTHVFQSVFFGYFSSSSSGLFCFSVFFFSLPFALTPPHPLLPSSPGPHFASQPLSS